ncbi:substrate-binding domain-containing protein [Fimbriimonas ginsengisoli]|uniref:Putative L-rhamnose ABC transporter, substrate-binding component n=1 Tax=Fimbriimonas ginsengisoli Gsoil 348 TaxID=661478 RepID=A0A068NLD1_FIMGI|nr:substrate-binding domain-containing protein [Fimbriimonas ginsengisoli]AIE84383.1 putative L-rhamnose ABC transporter, substrate-binding component [Fimbriimonas ginsengisoli Gsoil 348]
MLKNLVWGVAAFAAIGLSGCGSSDNGTGTTGGDTGAATTTGGKTAATGGAKKTLKIVMIAKSSNNPVFQSAKTGAEAAAKDLGAKNNADIQVVWATPPEENGEEQARRIAQAVNDGANAILVSCSDAAKVTNAINDAVDKGVPVMTFDSDAPDSKRFAFYGADDVDAGHLVMKELGAVTNGKGNYAILSGNQTAPNLQKRVQGVKDEAKNFPGLKLVNTFYLTKETPQDASAEVTRAMNANPQIDCWAMVGGWPLFNTALLSLDPAKVKIVAVDALPEELEYVSKGIAPTLLAQPTYLWGHKSVEIIVDKLLLNKDVPAITKMDLVKVTKETLPTWSKQLQDWGFKVDPKYLAAAK